MNTKERIGFIWSEYRDSFASRFLWEAGSLFRSVQPSRATVPRTVAFDRSNPSTLANKKAHPLGGLSYLVRVSEFVCIPFHYGSGIIVSLRPAAFDRSNPSALANKKAHPLGGLSYLVGVSGFEPEASWTRTKRDTKLRHTPIAKIL